MLGNVKLPGIPGQLEAAKTAAANAVASRAMTRAANLLSHGQTQARDIYAKMRVLGPTTPTGTFIMVALLVGIVVAVLVCVVDAIHPFLPSNPFGSGPSAAARAGKLFWTKSAESGEENENMVVPASFSPITSASTYSLSVQLVVGDTRNVGMFRHILHRGSNMCNLPLPVGLTPGATGHAGIQAELSDTSGGSSSSTIISSSSYGLPAFMNPGILLDRFKNDIHVFVHTKGHVQSDGSGSGGQETWLESLTLEDIPLNTPITLGVVCNGRSLEVYVNCKLYSTLLLRGLPITLSAENSNWFGRCCAYPVSGLIQNLQLWGDALGPGDYAKVCKTTGGPDPANVPKLCPTSGTSSSCSAFAK